ncbi:MAG: LysR substrate-binding domain-containing protein [Thiolinea sp.]
MAPSFAAKWLVPRLHLFSKAHPEIEMRISGDTQLIDAPRNADNLEELFRAHDIDAMIRFGSGNYPGCDVHKLFSVQAVPLCTPALAKDRKNPLRRPEDLANHILLHDDTPYPGRPSWAKWLEKFSVQGVDIHRGLHFNQVSMGLAAALDGQGVLLSLDVLACHDIAAGRLCIPFDLKMPLDHAYYLIRPKSAMANHDATDSFVNWVLEESTRLIKL